MSEKDVKERESERARENDVRGENDARERKRAERKSRKKICILLSEGYELLTTDR